MSLDPELRAATVKACATDIMQHAGPALIEMRLRYKLGDADFEHLVRVVSDLIGESIERTCLMCVDIIDDVAREDGSDAD